MSTPPIGQRASVTPIYFPILAMTMLGPLVFGIGLLLSTPYTAAPSAYRVTELEEILAARDSP